MSAVWWTFALLMLGTIVIKAAGPVALGDRPLPPRLTRMIGFLTPALLAALVVQGTLAGGPHGVTVDVRLAGLLVAAGALALRLPLLVVIALAAATAALLRALT